MSSNINNHSTLNSEYNEEDLCIYPAEKSFHMHLR